MTRRTYTRRATTSAAGSQKPTCKQYGVKPVCQGCGRKLVIKDETALWFEGYPRKAVFGPCCFHLATKVTPRESTDLHARTRATGSASLGATSEAT